MMGTTIRISVAILFIFFFIGCAGSPETTETRSEPATEAAEPSDEGQTASPETTDAPDETDAQTTAAEETPPAEPLSESSSAVTLRPGTGSFSPVQSDEQRFFIDGAASQDIREWSFVVTDASGAVVHEERGTGAPPEVLAWDGTINGENAPEGTYASTLTLTYADESTRTVETNPFLVDMTDPRPSFALRGVPFTPDGDGVRDELIITIDAEDVSPIQAWLFEIQTTDGETLARYTDNSDVPRTARWNGRPGGGYTVQSGDEYVVRGGVRDEAGNEGVTETLFIVGALTEAYNGQRRVQLPAIRFPANSARIADAPLSDRRRFDDVVDRMARILSATEGRILIRGHANATRFSGNRPDPEEQRNELVPLSRDRAAAVRNALIERGIAASRLEIEGVGASDPVASFADATGRSRNRRIEFYIVE